MIHSVTRCFLTIELSGQAQRPFRAGEHAIYCEHGTAAMTAGPLQRIVRAHDHRPTLVSTTIGNPLGRGC
jgi:hypothetical protein